jgi:hypothetical protein
MAKKQTAEESSLALLKDLKSVEEYQILLDSGAIPAALDTVQKLMTVVQTGKELGMGPMAAINNINIIKGRTVISSAMLGALLKSRNIEYIYTKDWVKEPNEKGEDTIRTEIEFEWISSVSRKPKTAKFSISWAEMEIAGYTSREQWEKYPKNMLRARCMAYAVRALFPEILLGIYTDTEIVDAFNTNHTIDLDEEGGTVIVEATHTEE